MFEKGYELVQMILLEMLSFVLSKHFLQNMIKNTVHYCNSILQFCYCQHFSNHIFNIYLYYFERIFISDYKCYVRTS